MDFDKKLSRKELRVPGPNGGFTVRFKGVKLETAHCRFGKL